MFNEMSPALDKWSDLVGAHQLVAFQPRDGGVDSRARTGQRSRWDGDGWRTQAACSGFNPLLFFPNGELGDGVAQATLAKAICASCPVSHECLEFAISTFQNDGIWGGLTEDERRRVKRARRAKLRRRAPKVAIPDEFDSDDGTMYG